MGTPFCREVQGTFTREDLVNIYLLMPYDNAYFILVVS